MNRSIKALLLAAAMLTLSHGAFAQDRRDPPLITVSGQAEVLVVPDEVVFNLTVETVDKDLLVAQAKNDQTVKSVFALARKYQIPPTQMQTSQIRLEKKYSSEEITKRPAVFIGYAVIKKVALILRDVSKADELLADIFKSGVTEIDDVDFRTTQIRKYKDQARALAIKAAQEKAIALTKEIGQSIGRAYSISEGSFPIQALSNNYIGRASASASYSDDESTIALGQISVTANVVVSFELSESFPMTLGNSETIQHPDGRVELQPAAAEQIRSSPLFNEDLAPVPVARRNWTTYNYAALWISMAHCIPTYMLSSGLISAGMNWWQALITILLGNTIVLVPILLNSHPGTKYGIPFPVFARAAYGTYGSNLPALMRAIVACGWFGIQAWIGGEALNTLFSVIPGWRSFLGGPYGGHMGTEWLSFLIFWAINIYIIYRGMDLLRKVENWAAPFVLVMTSLLLAWALWKANGLGYLLTQQSKFHSLGEFWPIFIISLTGMIGFWATLSLNMPDFTRFGHSQREQTIGQVVALPTTMTVFAAMGVMITSAAVVIYPHMKMEELWDPMKLVGQFHSVAVIAISMFTVVVATLAVNIAANVVSPANDFANAFPKWISFRTGGLITGIIGIAMQPWRLLADPSGYIFAWLVGYSGGLGSIAGVLIADYWLVHKKQLELPDLYRTRGAYTFLGGWNWRAVIATLLGCALAWGGVILQRFGIKVQWLLDLYAYAWFVGFGAAAVTHFVLMKLVPPSPAARD